MAGSTPSVVSEKRERQWAESRIRQQHDQRRRAIYRDIRLFVNRPAHRQRHQDWLGILKAVEEYNARVERQGHHFVTRITESTTKRIASEAKRPSLAERRAVLAQAR